MKRISLLLFLAVSVALLPGVGRAEEEEKVIRQGMIGLDTSHGIAFTSYLSNAKNKTDCRVVAGFPGGSPDFPASANRVDKFTEQLREKHGLEIVESIEELCEKVDGILLGRQSYRHVSRLARRPDRFQDDHLWQQEHGHR